MKIKLILGILLLIASFARAQQVPAPCQHTFTAEVTPGTDPARSYYAVLNWDFTSVDVVTNEVQIELLPIVDCHNGPEAVHFRDASMVRVNSSNQKGVADLTLDAMGVKCFKWRVVIKGVCPSTSDWTYHSYL